MSKSVATFISLIHPWRGRLLLPHREDDRVTSQSPTVRRRRLAAELRRLREQRGLSIDQVSAAGNWHATKLSRMETGRRGASTADVRTLLKLYKVPETEAEALLTLAREARERGWWEAYRDVLPPRHSTYIGLEADAASVRNYESLLVPGLLQTARYARAVIGAGLRGASEDEVESRVAVRLARQSLLREGRLHLSAIVDEAAIRRLVGDRSVMEEQIDHIAEMSKLANVSFQVIPYSAGAHPGMTGSFSILEFPPETDADVVYIDSAAGDLFVERESEVSRYTLDFGNLQEIAASPTDSVRFISDSQGVGSDARRA
ncbi:helix-turn-helix domain-containing protein [Nonomuraea sp. NPDC050022]|uniref:helix-turn-helix domain-containing protein n=1 Tax=Nonomuraea sp. NPDC050022 TaxID=3364358 RepID=UPI0037986BB5